MKLGDTWKYVIKVAPLIVAHILYCSANREVDSLLMEEFIGYIYIASINDKMPVFTTGLRLPYIYAPFGDIVGVVINLRQHRLEINSRVTIYHCLLGIILIYTCIPSSVISRAPFSSQNYLNLGGNYYIVTLVKNTVSETGLCGYKSMFLCQT